MPNDLSRHEERRGWRKAYLWVIPAALLVGLILAVWLPVAPTPPESGMEKASQAQAPQPEKQALARATVQVKSDSALGSYLTDDSGRPLYLFKKDKQGGAGRQPESTCYDDCAKSWPPLLTSSEPKATSPAKPELIGTIARNDGSQQVTYNGWPLYRYVSDVGPQKATGHDVEDFGGEWYLVSPSGEEAGANEDAGRS